MSAHSGPKISTNSLVAHLDAVNIKSYARSGSTWRNLTSTDNVTLTGTVAYSPGYITFDGTTTYADFSISNISTTVTFELLVRMKGLSSNMPFGWGSYDLYGNAGALGFNTANSDVYGLTATQVTNLGILNNWVHLVCEMRSDVSYTNNKIYVNGNIQTLSQVLGAENAPTRTFNSGNGRISGWRGDTNYKTNMDLAIFKVYNRALTAAEVKQNYNAIRGRYK